jgi:hypothetical protein
MWSAHIKLLASAIEWMLFRRALRRAHYYSKSNPYILLTIQSISLDRIDIDLGPRVLPVEAYLIHLSIIDLLPDNKPSVIYLSSCDAICLSTSLYPLS